MLEDDDDEGGGWVIVKEALVEGGIGLRETAL